jgi:2-polyprenyl-3-methyl-5-hydroxy-6-metoxy-1,4-benzoquinol methylase
MQAEYLLDNAAAQTGQRFSGLEATFDSATFRYLAATGVGPGWACWEIGAGGGSIARWLAGQVAPGGSVLATDLELKWMPESSAVRVERHDVASDPIPQNAYDLIHARLVLTHLPARDRVLAALAAALRPGGWLVVEDFDTAFDDGTHPATADEAFLRFVNHAFRQMLKLRGGDASYARTLPHRLEQAGLCEVGGEGRLVFARGGSAGASVHVANLRQVGDHMTAARLVTGEQVSRAISLLEDPALIWAMPIMITAWGRKGQ